MTLLDHVVQLLDTHHIPHALIGAAALASAGVSRSTFDIDLLTMDRAVLADGMWTPIRQAGGAVEVRHGDADDPLAGVVRLVQRGERPVDVIVGRHGWQARAIQRAVAMSAGPPVVQPRDLILLKLYAGGSQDLWDIRELLHGPGAEALATEVNVDLGEQPQRMRDLWNEARR